MNKCVFNTIFFSTSNTLYNGCKIYIYIYIYIYNVIYYEHTSVEITN